MTEHTCFAWVVLPIGHRCVECGQLEPIDDIDLRILGAQRRINEGIASSIPPKPPKPLQGRNTRPKGSAGHSRARRGQSRASSSRHQTPGAP